MLFSLQYVTDFLEKWPLYFRLVADLLKSGYITCDENITEMYFYLMQRG